MNNKTHNKVLLRVLVALLAVTLLFGIFAAPQAEAANYKASYIELMENDLKLNISDYFDSSVAYQLPESVKDDQEISVIITMSIDDLMDSYEKTDKSVSFKEYALQGAAAKEIEAQVAEKKTEVLEELDQLAIGYDIGEDYSVLLTGFSIVIRAGDFKALCKSLESLYDSLIISSDFVTDLKFLAEYLFCVLILLAVGIHDSKISDQVGSLIGIAAYAAAEFDRFCKCFLSAFKIAGALLNL